MVGEVEEEIRQRWIGAGLDPLGLPGVEVGTSHSMRGAFKSRENRLGENHLPNVLRGEAIFLGHWDVERTAALPGQTDNLFDERLGERPTRVPL